MPEQRDADDPGRPVGESRVAHEHADIDPLAVAKVGGVAAVVIAGGMAAVLVFGHVLDAAQQAGQPDVTAAQTTPIVPPEPRLQPEPWRDIRNLRAREEQGLTTYAFVSPDRSRARIPLEAAEALIVGRSLDTPPP